MVRDKAHSIAHRLETAWDKARFRVKRAAGLLGTPVILAYHGFGSAEELWVRGRVLEENGAITAPHSDRTLDNIRLTLKRYETDEIRGARIAWKGAGQGGTVETDAEGYFDFHVLRPDIAGAAPWLDVELTLEEAPGYDLRPVSAMAPVRIVSPRARFGIISDIDDTIVETGATNFLKHWRTVVANSAEGRTAFPGVTHLYRGLASGEAGPETNPIFYVSSSPWNLFDLFERFMVLHRIPPGPMLLKDFGLDAGKWLTGNHDDHKLAMIRRVLECYPHLPFVLIGDSGQRDPMIYAEAARRSPGRILAVHIRDVTPGSRSPAFVAAIEALEAAGVEVTINPDMAEAARVSRAQGLVPAGTPGEVFAAIEKRRLDEARRP